MRLVYSKFFRDVWGLDDTVLAVCGADCPDPNNFANGMLDHIYKTYPNMRVGLFSNTADLVIRTFMGWGYCDNTWNKCTGVSTIIPANLFEQGLLTIRAEYQNQSSSYFIGQTQALYNFGQNHTALRSPSFWTTIIDGVPLSDWVGNVINGDIQHVGP
ncbi:MAG: hypothetical protein IPK82_38160 [Polyangiaceae bacterium]|nr:hypothetical protein [Polyangiaceae bacterium]